MSAADVVRVASRRPVQRPGGTTVPCPAVDQSARLSAVEAQLRALVAAVDQLVGVQIAEPPAADRPAEPTVPRRRFWHDVAYADVILPLVAVLIVLLVLVAWVA